MKTRYSIKNIKENSLKSQNNIWNVLFAEYFAIRLIWVIANFTKITPNIITFFSFLLFLGSGYLFYTGMFIAGALMYEFAHFMDIVDGRLASLKKKSSKLGVLYDTLADLIGVIVITFGISLYSYNETNNILFLLIGFIYIVLVLMLQILYNLSYKLNDNKLLIKKISIDKTSLLSKIRTYLSKKRIRTLYTNVETNNLIFFICPLLFFYLGFPAIFFGFIIADIALLLLFVLLFYMQFKVLKKIK